MRGVFYAEIWPPQDPDPTCFRCGGTGAAHDAPSED